MNLKKLLLIATVVAALVSSHTFAADLATSSDDSKSISNGRFNLELSTKYVYSKNHTKFQSQHNTTNGIPETGATLDWSGLYSNNIELNAKLTDKETNLFTKGAVNVGKGFDKSGLMRDTDYKSNGQTIGDSTSEAKVSHDQNIRIDFGKDYIINETKVSPFVGFYYAKTKLDSFGVTFNPVDDPAVIYTPNAITPGVFANTSVLGLAYETIIKAPRVGVLLSQSLSEALSVDVEVALMPYAHMTLNDWHYQNPSKVQDGNPNGVAKGTGWGYSTDVLINYQLTKASKVGVGVRYTDFIMHNSDFTDRMVTGTNTTTDGLKELSIQNFGLMASYQYKF